MDVQDLNSNLTHACIDVDRQPVANQFEGLGNDNAWLVSSAKGYETVAS